MGDLADTPDLGERFLRVVRSLFVLMKSIEDVTASAEESAEAAAECVERLQAVFETEPYLVLQERAGGLGVNGVRLRPGVDAFVAVDALAQLLRTWRVSELQITVGVEPADLIRMAVALAQHGPEAMAVDRGKVLSDASSAFLRLDSRDDDTLPALRVEKPETSGSMIRSMFVANRLTQALESRDATVADREVLQSVVELLVCEEPILRTVTLIERDEVLFARSVAASVHAVHLAQALGASRSYQLEIAVAALLHGIGQVVGDDSASEGVAGMRHLLEVGRHDDTLLRAILVVRRLGLDEGMSGPGSLSVAIVEAALLLATQPTSGGEPDLATQGRSRGWPESLCQVVEMV